MDAPATTIQPIERIEQADQFPVAGDEVWIRGEFKSIHHGGVVVKVKAPQNMTQYIVVDGLEVFAQLRVGHVLESYGQ